MEPEPPPITIVDPRAPAGPDLLVVGEERDPWQWTPRRRRVAGAALAVAVVVVTVGALTTWVQARHRADRAALAALVLSAQEVLGVVPDGEVGVAVRNAGPDPVRLLSARLLAPGYAEQPLHEVLEPDGTAVLQLAETATCGPDLLEDPARTLRVQVRTHRGQSTTRDLPLGFAAREEVNRLPRERCGYLPPEESFGFGVQSLQRRGREVVVKALVHDDSVLPLVLVRLAADPGLAVEVAPGLPLRLPEQSAGRRISHFLDLTLRLRVTDCPTFFNAPPFGYGDTRDQLVRAWVERDGTQVQVPLALSEPEVGGEESPDAILRLLLRSCAPRPIDRPPSTSRP